MQIVKIISTLVCAALLASCGGGGAFTIGGNVTGLSSGGSNDTPLILTNIINLDTVTVNFDSSSTSYTFPTTLATGEMYSVSVSQQPTGLTCNPASTGDRPAGTITSSNVENINFQCQPNSGIGSVVFVSVGGLGSGTLVLLLNGDTNNPLSITTAGGTTMLAFPKPQLPGVFFNVSVAPGGNPAGQTCTVGTGPDGGRGVMPSSGSPGTIPVFCS